jgi:hypothetical protein
MNIVQIQNRVQELPNTLQTMRYLNAALNGQVKTIPPYIAAVELQRRESDGMMDQLAKGAAKGPQRTVKDQLEEKVGIMALMGQQQPPQRPQIPQPAPAEQQPQAGGGIDNLPVKEDMFGMAGGGIVAFNGETGSYATRTDVPLFNWLRRLSESIENAPKRGQGTSQEVRDRRAAAEAAEQAKRDALAREFTRGVAEEDATVRLTPVSGAANRQQNQQRQNQQRQNQQRNRQQGNPPPAAPPVVPPTVAPTTTLADLAPAPPSRTLEDALGADPAYKKMQELLNKSNPYARPQETQEAYNQRIRGGILSQIPGGKMPWETSEARLREIEARRAREDEEYEAKAKSPSRRFDDFLTFASNVGQGSFGQGASQGVRALQGVERSREAESTRRKNLRDEQSMRLMEIRALNDQAAIAYATGNVKEYERLKQEALKLQTEFELKQGDIAKGITDVGATARKGDVEDKRSRDVLAEESRRAKEKLDEESRQKELERQKDIQVARIQVAGQAAARAAGADDKTIQLAEAAFARDPEAQAIKKRLESSVNPARRETDIKRLREIQAEKYKQFGIKLEGAPSPGAPVGGNRPPLSSFQR